MLPVPVDVYQVLIVFKQMKLVNYASPFEALSIKALKPSHVVVRCLSGAIKYCKMVSRKIGRSNLF